jgi:hypothetical protein
LAPATASDLVTLLGNLDTDCVPEGGARLVNQQQKADGTTAPFAVPARQVLVVTSYDFIFSGGTPSQRMQVPLVVVDATLTQVAYVGTGHTIADSAGNGGGTITLPSGFAVKSGTRLCFQFAPNVTAGAVIVRGFLAPDR